MVRSRYGNAKTYRYQLGKNEMVMRKQTRVPICYEADMVMRKQTQVAIRCESDMVIGRQTHRFDVRQIW